MEGLLLPVGEELLTPTRIYVKSILNLVKNFSLKGLVHITGGGFTDNIPRILPERCSALIHRGSWPELPVFQAIRKQGRIDDAEMFRVFNMGIGMMIIVDGEAVPEILARLAALGEQAYLDRLDREAAAGRAACRHCLMGRAGDHPCRES